MNNKKKSALIAMSGGVDSSVAALLTVEQGFDCIGGMMQFFDVDQNSEGSCDSLSETQGTCGSSVDARDAEIIAGKLDIPFYIWDFADSFKKHVIHPFVCSYQRGETPNPCISCNRHLKFDGFSRKAKELGREYIVTGHYAQIETDRANDRFLLKKSVDLSRDQSYVLYTLTQAQLKSTLFPLGTLHKTQVRELALAHGFTNAQKPDSQDICFVQNGDYASFIRQYTDHPCREISSAIKSYKTGRFVDTAGNDLGEHKGIIHYTIGQRKGLGLSISKARQSKQSLTKPEPLYVCQIDPNSNQVTVGSESALYSKTLFAKNINLIPMDRLEKPLKVKAKIRYNQTEQAATVWQTGEDVLRVEFDQTQRAITKGQSVVLYDGDIVVGGGIISEVEDI